MHACLSCGELVSTRSLAHAHKAEESRECLSLFLDIEQCVPADAPARR